MATIYVYSGATGANNGTSWTDAYTTFGAAVTAWTTADTIWLASDHSETATSFNFTSANDSETNPVPVYSIDRSTNQLKRATSAQIAATSTTLTIGVLCSMNGVYFSGWSAITLSAGIGGKYYFKDCTFELPRTTTTANWNFSGPSANISLIECDNCSFIASSSGVDAYITPTRALLRLRGGSVSVANSATNGLFRLAVGSVVVCEGVDFSGTTINNYMVYTTSVNACTVDIINCKLPASFTPSGGSDNNTLIQFIASDSAGNLDRYEFYGLNTSSIVSTSSIYRDAGYSGAANQVSFKMSKGNLTYDYAPLRTPQLMGYISTTGSKTFTVEIAHDYTASLKDSEIYLEIAYLGTTGSVHQTLATTITAPTSCTHDPLKTNEATLSSSSETWTGAGALTKQKISKTVTVNKAGLYAVRVCLDKYESGKFCYVDPVVTVA